MDDLSLADYLAIFVRWKRHFLTSFSALMVISTIFVLNWSNYRSTATVEIEQPQVAPVITPSGVPETLADLRVNKIQQKVTAPASLVDIITKYNLYPDARRSKPMDYIARDMVGKIKLGLISSIISNPAATSKVSVDQLAATAFTLSFDYDDPKLANKVTSELIARFLDEDMKDSRQDAKGTAEFLDNQIKSLEDLLEDQERKIAKFKSEHGISGPAEVMFNQQAVTSTSFSIQNLDSQIATNEGTQGTVRAQLSSVDPYSRVLANGQVMTTPAIELKALQEQYSSLKAQYGPEHPDVIKASRQMETLRRETGITAEADPSNDTADLEVQIKDIKTNLAAAQRTYGPLNPDVISLNKQVSSLAKELAGARKKPSSHDAVKQDADNPFYLSLVAQLNSLEEQHKSLLEERRSLAAQQEKYEKALAKDPALEQEMAVLARDYDSAVQRHRELKGRKMAADMEMNMIEDHKAQHLVLISPPDVPIHTHPRGIFLFLGGIFFSTFGGMATVIIAQMLNQSIIGTRRLALLVGTPPLVAVPYLYTQAEKDNALHKVTLEILRTLGARGRELYRAYTQSRKIKNG